ncbi:MAG: hypothetical protein M3281_04405 [Chloroflexota bacterium]|nr:hypothetical protein [Chloroflexota bacterium]
MRDWIDFVTLDGIQYVRTTPAPGRELRWEDLGPVHATVRFKLHSNVHDVSYRPGDGDAAFLEAGTRLYRVRGFRPEFRLAACREHDLILYEADTNPRARVGQDLLDLGGKVRYIGVNSGEDGMTELGAVRGREASRLVEMVLKAPVAQNRRSNARSEQYFIAFHLVDGTVVSRAYWPGTGELWRGIWLPGEFARVVERAARARGKHKRVEPRLVPPVVPDAE